MYDVAELVKLDYFQPMPEKLQGEERSGDISGIVFMSSRLNTNV